MAHEQYILSIDGKQDRIIDIDSVNKTVKFYVFLGYDGEGQKVYHPRSTHTHVDNIVDFVMGVFETVRTFDGEYERTHGQFVRHNSCFNFIKSR